MVNNNKTKKTKKSLIYKTPVPKLNLVDHVAGLVNPFSDEAIGSKIHDSNGSRTFTFKSVSRFALTTGTAGVGYTEFYPALKEAVRTGVSPMVIPSTLIIPGSPTYNVHDVSEYTNFAASTSRYRIVSWGIRLTCPTTAFDTKGEILVRELEGVKYGASNDAGYYSTNYMRVPLTHDLDITIIPDHQGDAYMKFGEVQETYELNAADPARENPFKCVSVTVIGGIASVTALNAEVVFNLECIPVISSLAARQVTPAAPHSTHLLEAAHNTRSAVPIVHKTSSLWSKIKGFAKDALSTGAEMVLGKAGGMLSKYLMGKAQMLPALVGPRPQLLLRN
jgi:hypothetical protein